MRRQRQHLIATYRQDAGDTRRVRPAKRDLSIPERFKSLEKLDNASFFRQKWAEEEAKMHTLPNIHYRNGDHRDMLAPKGDHEGRLYLRDVHSAPAPMRTLENASEQLQLEDIPAAHPQHLTASTFSAGDTPGAETASPASGPGSKVVSYNATVGRQPEKLQGERELNRLVKQILRDVVVREGHLAQLQVSLHGGGTGLMSGSLH